MVFELGLGIEFRIEINFANPSGFVDAKSAAVFKCSFLKELIEIP